MTENTSRNDSIAEHHSQATELTQLNESYGSPSTPGTHARASTAYSGGGHDTEPLKSETPIHQAPEKLSVLRVVLPQTFALLWIVPIVALLVLNIKGHIIGASAWCPGGHCFPQVYSDDTSKAAQVIAHDDRESHNLLGGLQLAAKALEVWFTMITTWLVYLVTVRLANAPSGIPMGYLTRPSEFAELPSLLDSVFWSILWRMTGRGAGVKKSRRRIWISIGVTIFLCVLCNLMGPSVAVLVLPSLQWQAVKGYGNLTFTTWNSNNPPSIGGFARQDGFPCSPSDFLARNYSCASRTPNYLDAWVETSFTTSSTDTAIVSAQDLVSFRYNSSRMRTPGGHRDLIVWTPNRQVLQQLSNDLKAVRFLSTGHTREETADKARLDSFIPFNNTVESVIHRKGPVLGGLVNTWMGYNVEKHFTVSLETDKSIRCYRNYNLSNTPRCWGSCDAFKTGNYTRCIPLGTGWPGYKTASFSIDQKWNKEIDDFGPYLQFNIYSTPVAAFLPNGTLPSSLTSAGFSSKCLDYSLKAGTDRGECNWDAFWETGSTDLFLKPRSENVTTIQLDWNPSDDPGFANNTHLAIDFVAFRTFADYTLDPSRLSNPLWSTNTILNFTQELLPLVPVPVDPAWTLNAWSADFNGIVDATRGAPSRFQKLFDHFADLYKTRNSLDPLWDQRTYLNGVGLMPVLQTLSMIEYNTTEVKESPTVEDPEHPLLLREGQIYVWAYGMSSRTAYLGVAVTICGCIVVLVEIVLGLVDRRAFRSPTQLLIAALEHRYHGEFAGAKNTKSAARIPFRMEPDMYAVGKFKFEKVV